MTSYNWMKHVGPDMDPVWIDSTHHLALRAEYDEEEDIYNILLQNNEHLPPRDIRKLGEAEEKEEAYAAIEELTDSEALENLLEESQEKFPTQFSY